MFVHYRTSGLIFKKEDRGEADQLLTVFTKDFGKLEILGKAIRKIKSKLRSGAELFYLSEIEFIQGKTYKTLTDAFLIENFQNLRKDLKKLAVAFKISETLDSLVKGQEPDEKIWDLLRETFQKLNTFHLKPKTLSPSSPKGLLPGYYLIYYYFFWNLLSILGYQPELYNCPLCQKKLTIEKLYFSPKEGGVICSQCKKSIKSGKKIDPDTIKILRILLKKDWLTLNRIKIEAQNQKSLKMISDYYRLAALE